MTNMSNTSELSFDDLDAVSGGKQAAGSFAQTLSIGCEALGHVAEAVGATVVAFHLYEAAATLIE